MGIFPAGTTSLGIHDLSSNVWEWTLRLYKDYPYDPEDGRNNPEGEGIRVLRGGSWGVDQGFVRCVMRDWNLPDYFYDLSGFRVVVSLANSEF